MRKLLLTLAIVCGFTFTALSQTASDSITNSSININQKEIKKTNRKLEKFRKEHQNGTNCTYIGVGLTSFGIDNLYRNNKFEGKALIFGGVFFGIIGEYIKIDSYKHLKEK